MIFNRKRQETYGRACLGFLLILALMLRAAIPDGFMPSAGKAGMAHMAVCPGMAGMQHHGGADGKKGRGPSHSSPCAYTLVLSHDAPGHAPLVQAPAFGEAVLSVAAAFLPDPANVKPWFPRGPPLLLMHI